MAKLSKLEESVLKDFLGEINKIKASYHKHSDSIEDVLCDQVTVESNEPSTLASAMEHFKTSGESLSKIFERLELIEDHFLSIGK